jgi:DNA-binding transcriptional regulator YhcF (GntR family)
VRRGSGHGYYLTSSEETGDDQREAEQVARILLGRILSATIRAGSPVPPGAELAAELGVTSDTIARALASLASQGVIERTAEGAYQVRTSFTVPYPGTLLDERAQRWSPRVDHWSPPQRADGVAPPSRVVLSGSLS